MKNLWFSCFVVLFLFNNSQAMALDEKIVQISNEFIMNIFNEMMTIKSSHTELADFDQSALKVNPYGIYAIQYDFIDERSEDGEPSYAIGLNIVQSDDFVFSERADSFDFQFPLLTLKVTGYQQKYSVRQYDIEQAVRKFGQIFWDLQQDEMPFRLKVTSEKQTYSVSEPIDFTVHISNVTEKNMYVKSLSNANLNLLLNQDIWISKIQVTQTPSKRDVLLKARDSIQRKFKIKGLAEPEKIDIFCEYNMMFGGVRPSSTLFLEIVP